MENDIIGREHELQLLQDLYDSPKAELIAMIERGDKTINLCEMKYTSRSFIISSDYADWLKQRRETFRLLTGTNKTLHLTMISASGVEHNAGWQILQSEVGLDDLFDKI